MTILTSARLRFEPFDDAHVTGLHAMNRDPEVMRYLGGRPDTLDDTRAAIARVRGRWAQRPYDWWALIETGTGQLVGAAGLYHLGHDAANPHEIGWRLRRDCWGRGLASEAARTIAAYGFGQLALPLLCAVRDPQNDASRRVMERLGMRYVGMQTWHGSQVAVHELARAGWQA